jgi:hypothetical protein
LDLGAELEMMCFQNDAPGRGGIVKKYLADKEMSDPDWIHKKQQDWFALKAAWQRFEWGSAYLETFHIICRELDGMDEPIKAWKVEKPRYYNKRIARRLAKAAVRPGGVK